MMNKNNMSVGLLHVQLQLKRVQMKGNAYLENESQCGENIPYRICEQRRLRSACANAQADLSLRCPITESLYIVEYINEYSISFSGCTGCAG